ncbi:MotE family protein [Maritimibacter alkaliphilus]|uniref:MotE family protein n=1 Tax=Maritimibacter alkaliphilus TaxID=404236 RepID=UPI001C9834F2|nr:hypothetical protein [Maritimibacter alkaliphilus]MBY6093023.1 hypothetical protein [Maritimibacter alkaliphilus]
MWQPRPFAVIIAALALTGVVKAGMTLTTDPAALPATPVDMLFVSRASAAGPATPPAEAPVAEKQQIQAALDTSCGVPEDMLRAIREERELLEAQKDQLAQRASELDLAGEALAQERTQLGDLKTEVVAMLDRAQAAHTSDVDRLVALYSNMKPKEAALIMDELDIEVSVMVLGTMNERDAAPILAALNPTRARAISRIIMERSKLPGDQRLDNLKL